jgi:DHA3 family tetracycline resistance protein-like MFS transporter
MATGLRARTNPYRLYLFGLEFGASFLIGMINTTAALYWYTRGHLNPLQLVLLGTMVELAYFVFQLPTGAIADLFSRRACVIAGTFAYAAGVIEQALSPVFANLLAAQILVGLGAALTYGAQEAWIADEMADVDMTKVYVRATQLGIIGSIGGSAISGVVALAGLQMPMLIGGSLTALLGFVLLVIMPENNFRGRRDREVHMLRGALANFREQAGAAKTAVLAVPALLLLFGAVFFLGMWSESFDRLWAPFLIHSIPFPHLFGGRQSIWFSVIAVTVALFSLGTTELAKRRTDRLGPTSVATTLLAVTVLIGVGVVLLAGAHLFVVAVGAYLLVEVVRPVFDPLLSGWMVTRIEPGLRATAFSAKDMCDAGGQMIGGPIVGVIGLLRSFRTALYAGALALAPAMALLAVASRRIHALPPAEREDLTPVS